LLVLRRWRLASSAALNDPSGVAVDRFGNIFIMDTGNCVIRKNHCLHRCHLHWAGALPDSSGKYYCDYQAMADRPPALSYIPIDLLIPAGGGCRDTAGTFSSRTTGNGVIRKGFRSTGIITTVAGIRSASTSAPRGGPATSSTLNAPYGVAWIAPANIFIADTHDYAIREVWQVTAYLHRGWQT